MSRRELCCNRYAADRHIYCDNCGSGPMCSKCYVEDHLGDKCRAIEDRQDDPAGSGDNTDLIP